MKKCTLALGCFWKPEENFKNKPGIIETEVGYAGGLSDKVTYEEVCKGDTGHAEVVRLTFDEKLISFKKILDLFFKMHDPTQKICNTLMLELNIEVKYFMKMTFKKLRLKKFWKFLIRNLMEKFKLIFLGSKIIVRQKNIIKST